MNDVTVACFSVGLLYIGTQMRADSSLVFGRKVEFSESCVNARGTPEGLHVAKVAGEKFSRDGCKRVCYCDNRRSRTAGYSGRSRFS